LGKGVEKTIPFYKSKGPSSKPLGNYGLSHRIKISNMEGED